MVSLPILGSFSFVHACLSVHRLFPTAVQGSRSMIARHAARRGARHQVLNSVQLLR